MKVYAPVKDVNGIFASVRFKNGVGETDNPALLHWFKKHGYRISGKPEKTEEPAGIKINREDVPENLDEMSPYEIREWALDHELGQVIGNRRGKDALLLAIRGCVKDEADS